ncbi:hypothetical protein N7454_002647 [Penicillium verhagenii]|nr:hypothetical protein N7454_002647 [Penicillium verhagenii]
MQSDNGNATPDEAMDTDMDVDGDVDDAHASSGEQAEQPMQNLGQVQCSVCSSKFRRPEHLKRHLRSHTKEKPFECAQCGRHFSRTDTLHRHELSHHNPGTDGSKDRTHRITVKTFRACFSCATARVRCSGGMPCGRCETRTLECQYPTERRSKARARNGARGPSGSGAHESEPQSPTRPARTQRHNSTVQVEQATSYQLAQFSVNGLNDPQIAPKPSIVPFQNTINTLAENTPSDGRGSVSGPPDPRLYLPPSNPSSSTGPLPLSTYQNGEYHETSNPDIPKIFSVETSAGIGHEMRNTQPGIPHSGADIDMDMTENPEINLDFDPSFFDQSMLSTINWLPIELFAGPTAGDQNQTSRAPSQFPQPTLPDSYIPHMAWHPPIVHADQISTSIPENISQTPSGHLSLGTDLGSPKRRPSHVPSEASPHSESVDSTKRSADYYVDGGGARLPKYRKRQANWSTSSAEVNSTKESFYGTNSRRFDFPAAHEVNMESISHEIIYSVRPIESTTYNEIYRNFILLCRSENPFFELFESDNFPSAEDCTRYLICYFDSFQAVYPMLHLPSFNPNKCYWLLTLALVAIGCHSSSSPMVDQHTAAFHELIRHALHVEKERYHPGQDSLDLIQVMLLNCIGLLHSGSERAKASALSSFKDLVTLMNREKILGMSKSSNIQGSSDDTKWINWVQEEVRRRTGYCIWLLDCTIAYYFDDRPLLSLDDGQAPLPAHETLWHAKSAEAWKQLWENPTNDFHSPGHSQTSSRNSPYTVNESLYDAVHILYIEKRLVSGIGEFSHILLIHALYHRMWEVGDYFRRPLSFWNPTAKKQSRETAIPIGSVWLPGIPSYSKWRNSACDCLDILHWTANSTIAKAAGLEHPTVLHLHSARLVLLAPFREIRSLATSLASNNLRWSRRTQAIEWQYIWRWIRHDQYKARLSIIHAGVTLWHVRRYSTNAFHEPAAVFIAVLTLWAYGSCYAHGPMESSPHSQGSRGAPSQEPSFIHLDRPCDDELVQLFVREGHSMRGNITGVGDICAPEGPGRVLQIGCEILSNLTAWGSSKSFIAILSRLADMVVRNPDAEHSRNGNADTR